MNYLSQKVVYAVEGYRTFSGQGWKLRAMRATQAARETQLALGDAADEVLPVDDVTSIKITPFATGFFRDALRDQIDGSRIAVRSALVAEDAIKQTWKETLQRSFLGSETPMAGNVDAFSRTGMMSIEDQYKTAQSVFEEKMAPLSEGYRWPMQLRNKLQWGIRTLANKPLNKATGVQLPVTGALQMMTAVDQRAGLRNYMTIRTNDLMMEQAAINPEGTLDDWAAAAREQLDDQLYQATPTKQNIEDAREQFGLSREELSDDEVSEYIVQTKVGMPVLNSPDQVAASNKAIAMRMQNKPTGKFFKGLDRTISSFREGEWGDSLIAFWRSPINGIAWDLALGTAPLSATYRTLQVAGYMVKGKEVPAELLVKAQASTVIATTMLATFAALESQKAVEGGGPIDPNGARLYRERLAAEGKVPNSIMGVPFNMGGLPILNTLFLYKDLLEVVRAGNVSQWDMKTAAMGIVSTLSAIILRTPAFAQVERVQQMLMAASPDMAGQFAAFWGNSQYNPASGAERMAEWGMGLQSGDLMRPVRESPEDNFDLSKLEEGHPLRSQWNALRNLTYYSNPALSHWLGTELKESTWLGRDVVRPDDIFRGEWPIGVPALWDSNKGEFNIEAQLEALGMLDPPSMIMNGSLEGVRVTESGRGELNQFMGTYRAPDTAGAFEDYSRAHPNGLTYSVGPIQYSRDEVRLASCLRLRKVGRLI